MNTAKLLVAGIEMDLKDDLGFGLNYSIDDVRKVEKKNSNYSKTITLAGSKTVNKLLGGLFDINADFTFFNPNIKTDAKIIVNSSTVIEGAMQLKDIKVINDSNTNSISVEYSVVVVSKSIDFMTDIKGKLLNELDLSHLDHKYTKDNIEGSWSNTSGFVYPLFWRGGSTGSNNYPLETFKPSIFYKTYLQKIAETAGYTLSGSLMDESTEEGRSLAKEIIPFAGKLPLIPAAEFTRRRFRASPTTDTEFSNGVMDVNFQTTETSQAQYDDGKLSVMNNDSTSPNFDNGGVYNPASTTYTIDVKGNYNISFQVDTKMTFSTASVTAYQSSYKPYQGTPYFLTLNPNSNANKYVVTFKLLKNGVQTGGTVSKNFYAPVSTGSNPTFDAANSYSIASSEEAFISFTGLNLSANDELTLAYSVGTSQYSVFTQYLTSYESNPNINVSTITRVPVNWKCEAIASTSYIYNSANSNALTQGGDILMSSFIPEKIKQTDLINDLVKRYNAYISVDADNDHNIILDTRDGFYEKGDVKDWTKLKDEGSVDNIKLLSELQNREMSFSYKKGSDYYSNSYFDATEQIYGSKTISFKNDFAKGEKKVESFFTSTVLINNSYNNPAAIVPSWTTDPSINKGFTVMYYNGVIPTIQNRRWFMYFEAGGSPSNQGYATYPYAGHLDNPFEPNLDLNFGTTAYSNYTLQENTTDATLYNRYWSNYVNQIDDGKLVTMYFNLDEVIIDSIRKGLNSKIWVKDSYYFINNIVDYNPLNNDLTKVELLKVKDGVRFSATNTAKNEQNLDNNDNGNPVGMSRAIQQDNILDSEKAVVSGSGNVVPESVDSIIIQGDNNTVLDGVKTAFIIGANDKTITEDNEGWIGDTHYLDGVVQEASNSMLLSEIFTLRDNGELVAGIEYHATDYDYYFTALSKTILDTNGRRRMKVVKASLYGSEGIFEDGVSYTSGDVIIWGGRVWDCILTGSSTPIDNLTLNPTYWNQSDLSTNYEVKSFDIKYSAVYNSIFEQSDEKGNVVVFDTNMYSLGFALNDGFDYSDWSVSSIQGNRCSIFVNNIAVNINTNNCKGIVNNKIQGGDITGNDIKGSISYNTLSGGTMSIINNNNSGNIFYNLATGSVVIDGNDNNGDIGASPSTTRTTSVIGTVVNL